MRSHAWYGCKPSLKTTIAPMAALTSFPDVIDCSQFRGPILNQGPYGTCTGHGVFETMDHYIRKRGTTYPISLSRLWLYYWGRFKEGAENVDNGAMISDVIDAAMERGVPTEENWPYTPEQTINFAPPDLSADAIQWKILKKQPVHASAAGIKTALMAGDPVVIGLTVFEGFEETDTLRDGIVRMPKRGEKSVGGHCVKIDASSKTIRSYCEGPNSWGDDVNRKGILFWPDAYLDEFSSDVWRITMVGSDAEKAAGVA